MCTVDCKNFEYLLPSIEKSIQDSSFIAIDTEFTGLGTLSAEKSSLFDTPGDRYKKLSCCASQFITCQIGLSAFQYDRHKNKYEAETYNFYTCPKYFGFEHFRFSCDASSLQFLCRFGFDFNKFIYDGIPYLNFEQEARLRKMLGNGSFQPSQIDSHVYQDYISKVNSLVVDEKEGREIILEIDMRFDIHIVQYELRRSFANIWTFDVDDSHVQVRRVSLDERKNLEESSDSFVEKIINKQTGFLRVIKLLISSKKPIVGHNLLTDLILVYNQFVRPLPKKYKAFKAEVHKIFPVIVDTKYLALELRHDDELCKKLLNSSVLYELYGNLNSRNGQQSILFAPGIGHSEKFQAYEGKDAHHEAGYDAYVCGYAFIRMIYRNASQKLSKEGHIKRAYSFCECLRQARDLTNKLHLMQANSLYLNLAGEDPPSQRPPLLVVTSKIPGASINVQEVAEDLSRYSSVEVVSRSSQRLLVAVSNHHGVREILQDFNEHPAWRVRCDTAIKTSTFIWGSLAVCSAMFCVLAISLARR